MHALTVHAISLFVFQLASCVRVCTTCYFEMTRYLSGLCEFSFQLPELQYISIRFWLLYMHSFCYELICIGWGSNFSCCYN
jgi:hypothetical protein